MFLLLSKILWLVAQPVSLTFILLVLGLLLAAARRRRTAWGCVSLAAALLGACAFTTVGYVAIDALENRFARPAPPEAVAGIIVLGGGMDAEVNTARGGWELNRAGDRFVEALRLALAYPEAKLVISGGGLSPGNEPEAVSGARFFSAFGIPENRMVLEGASRNTGENAELTRRLLDPAPGETWLLVTSAFHMPRAVGLFRKAGFDVVPWPADYLSTGREGLAVKLDQPAENLSVSTMALREWAGLAVYWMMGRIGEILPGPEVRS